MADSEPATMTASIPETEQPVTEHADKTTAAEITEDVSPPTDRPASPLVPANSNSPDDLEPVTEPAVPTEPAVLTEPERDTEPEASIVTDNVTDVQQPPEAVQATNAETVQESNEVREPEAFTEVEISTNPVDVPNVQQFTDAGQATEAEGESREPEEVTEPEDITHDQQSDRPEQATEAATAPETDEVAGFASAAEPQPAEPTVAPTAPPKKKAKKRAAGRPSSKKPQTSRAEEEHQPEVFEAEHFDPEPGTTEPHRNPTQGGGHWVQQPEATRYTGVPLTAGSAASLARDSFSLPVSSQRGVRHGKPAQTDGTEGGVAPRGGAPPEWSRNADTAHQPRSTKHSSRHHKQHRDRASKPSRNHEKSGTTRHRGSTRIDNSHGGPGRGHKSRYSDGHTSDHPPRRRTKTGSTGDHPRHKHRSEHRQQSTRQTSDGPRYASTERPVCASCSTM